MFKDTFELEVQCAKTGNWELIGRNDYVEDLEKRKAHLDSRKNPRWSDSRIIKVSRVVYA